MSKNNPNKPKIDAILDLLCALDGDLIKGLQKKDAPIILVTAFPASRLRQEDDSDDYDDEPEDDEDECCSEYEPSVDGTDRCAYSCPECGACLRGYIGEEFE